MPEEALTTEHGAAVGPDAVREHGRWFAAALDAAHGEALVAALQADRQQRLGGDPRTARVPPERLTPDA